MIFRASSTPRLMVCAGSHRLCKDRSDTSGAAALEGTEAHNYASDHLLNGTPLDNIPGVEMRAAVSQYVDVCNAHTGKIGIEEGHEITLSESTLRGTADFWSWSEQSVLTVIDFKYGHGWVEVRNNWQLLAYAVLMWMKHGNGTTPGKVVLKVVQPRANHPDGTVREWKFRGELLRNYRNMLDNQMAAARLEGAETVAGTHCRYCKAIVECHTNRGLVASIIDYAGTAEDSTLTGAGLAYELQVVKDAASVIAHRSTALEAYVTERLKQGDIVPGYNVTQTPGPLAWDTNPIDIIGDSVAQDAKPITPTQAINRKILTENQVKLMASRTLGAFKLRKINLNSAKRIIENAK